jgi:hypothetical protein
MTKVQELQAQLKEAKAAAKTAKGSKSKRIPLADRPTAPLTCGISMERRNESFNDHTNAKGKACKAWGKDYALLKFHGDDNVSHAIGTKLDTADVEGLKLVEEIKAYAKAQPGNSKVRFKPELGGWSGLATMFPPRLLVIAGYEVKS